MYRKACCPCYIDVMPNLIILSKRLTANLQSHHCPQFGDDTVSVPIAHREAPSFP